MNETALAHLVQEARRATSRAVIGTSGTRPGPASEARPGRGPSGRGRLSRGQLALAGAVLGSCMLSVWLVRHSLAGAELPREVPPRAVADLLDLETTTRIGTLLHARLAEAPRPGRSEAFDSAVRKLALRAGALGYESLILEAPDGTVLASGPLDALRVVGPGRRGT